MNFPKKFFLKNRLNRITFIIIAGILLSGPAYANSISFGFDKSTNNYAEDMYSQILGTIWEAYQTNGVGYDPSTDSRTFNLDIDGNGSVSALQDGLVIMRYLFGSRGDALISNVIDPLGTRATATEVEDYLAFGVSSMALDIDCNVSVDALTDGLVIIRYLFGSRGEGLIANVIDPLADSSLRLGIHASSIGDLGNSISDVTPTPTPEPTTMLLLGTGLVGVAGAARRRKKKNQA